MTRLSPDPAPRRPSALCILLTLLALLAFASPSRAIVVGSSTASPTTTPSDHVDPNLPSSPFSGVVSINTRNATTSLIGSGALISDRFIITAAHLLDISGGIIYGDWTTGDGLSDFTPSEVTIVFNSNNPSSTKEGATIQYGVKNIYLHPDWHGLNNSLAPEGYSINDDLAIIELNSPAPADAARYNLDRDAYTSPQQIILAGYGRSGDGVSGFTTDPDFYIKRTGFNLASDFRLDDEAPFSTREQFLYDFDGPSLSTNSLHDGLTLGNDLESIIGPGDSGGPAFSWIDNGDNIIQPSELYVFGINTFGRGGGSTPLWPYFGSIGGGTVISAYTSFIDSIAIPEPASLALLITLLPLTRRRLP